MAGRHSLERLAFAVARIGENPGERTGPLPRKVGSNTSVLRGIGNLAKASLGAPNRVWSVLNFAIGPNDIVEERAKRRTTEFDAGIGHDLHQALRIKFGADGNTRAVEDLEGAGFLAQLRDACLQGFIQRKQPGFELLQPAASGPAATAAAQAFLASRPSSTSLSSAAAAAALRSMSPPPTQVSQVQTKRMLQRQNSTSSIGGRPGLERQNSSGSMTERTFRSPSPNRLGSQTTSEGAPPVPPVPRNYAGSPTGRPERRAWPPPCPPTAAAPPPPPLRPGAPRDQPARQPVGPRIELGELRSCRRTPAPSDRASGRPGPRTAPGTSRAGPGGGARCSG